MRSEQQRLLVLLFTNTAFSTAQFHAPARLALNKRLQRARKFSLLVDVFGTPILHAVPQVAVTKMDGIRLEDLHSLAQREEWQARIERIITKMRSAPGPQVIRCLSQRKSNHTRDADAEQIATCFPCSV